MSGHAYSILTVRQASGEAAQPRTFLRLRNPWGKGEWQGAYSDHWPGWAQHPRLREELNVEAKDDGAFWMSMDDFAKNARTVECTYSDRPLRDSGQPFVSQGRGPLPGGGHGAGGHSPRPQSPGAGVCPSADRGRRVLDDSGRVPALGADKLLFLEGLVGSWERDCPEALSAMLHIQGR